VWLLLEPTFRKNISSHIGDSFHPDDGGDTFLRKVSLTRTTHLIPEDGIHLLSHHFIISSLCKMPHLPQRRMPTFVTVKKTMHMMHMPKIIGSVSVIYVTSSVSNFLIKISELIQ
jgi:hypothetical protein